MVITKWNQKNLDLKINYNKFIYLQEFSFIRNYFNTINLCYHHETKSIKIITQREMIKNKKNKEML